MGIGLKWKNKSAVLVGKGLTRTRGPYPPTLPFYVYPSYLIRWFLFGAYDPLWFFILTLLVACGGPRLRLHSVGILNYPYWLHIWNWNIPTDCIFGPEISPLTAYLVLKYPYWLHIWNWNMKYPYWLHILSGNIPTDCIFGPGISPLAALMRCMLPFSTHTHTHTCRRRASSTAFENAAWKRSTSCRRNKKPWKTRSVTCKT